MKLNWKRTFYVGLAFFGISTFWTAYDQIISNTLENIFFLNNTARGIIMALDNVLALFMLPLFGLLSDRTKSRHGRRTPYIVIGTIIASISLIFVAFQADVANRAVEASNATEIELLAKVAAPYLPVFILVLLVTLVAMSIFRSPAVALMPDVTPKPLRSKANAVINLMGALGGIIVLGLTFILYKDNLLTVPIFAAVSGIMLIVLVVYLIKVKENKLVSLMKVESIQYGVPYEEDKPEEKKPKEKMQKDIRNSMLFLLASVFLWFMAYNAVTTSFSVYAGDVWGMTGGKFTTPLLVAQGAAIIMFIPIGFLASKIGRKKTILIGIVLLGLAFGSSFLFKSYSAMILGFFALAGVGWATINVNSYPMVVEMSKSGSVGVFTGYYYTASMAAQILTPILSGVFMDNFGRMTLFPYAAVFMGLAFVTMLFVRHGDSKAELPKDKLEAYGAEK